MGIGYDDPNASWAPRQFAEKPAWMPQSIYDQVRASYDQIWSPYNQARMADEGSTLKGWEYGFDAGQLSDAERNAMGLQSGVYSNVDPFAADFGRSGWKMPRPEGFLDSGMGWMVPLGLAAGVAALGGGLGAAGAGEAAAGGTGLTMGAGGQTGLTLGAGGATGLTPAASTWAVPGWTAGGSGLGAGLSLGGGGETGLTYGAAGEGLQAPAGWGAMPAESIGFEAAPTGLEMSAGGQGLQYGGGGLGLKAPGAGAITGSTPTGFFDKLGTAMTDYFAPGGNISLSKLANLAGNLGSSFMQSRTSKDAALKQVQAMQQALGLQQQAYNDQQAALAPYRQAGTVALSDLMTGLSPGGRYTQSFAAPDFENDPAYQAQLAETMKAVQNSAAAKGSLKSGGTLRALEREAQGLAARTYGDAYNRWAQEQANDWNRRAGVAGIGQTAVNQLNAFGGQNANNQAQLLGALSNAQAAGQVGSTNAWTTALSNLLNQGSQQSILDALRRAGVLTY